MATIVVIGGGAAGFFAAIHLASAGHEVSILERGKAVLEKVRVSGGGRCNVTHACWEPKALVKHYPRGSKELLGPFHRFACGDTMDWFEKRGVALKIEEDGRVFPVSDSSASIVDCLWQTAKANGVKVLTQIRVDGFQYQSQANRPWKVNSGSQVWEADRLVICTGSNPAVWRLLADLGLSIVPAVPSLFAFNIAEKALHALSGVSLPWVELKVVGEASLYTEGPLLITHKGMSGPAVLRLSAWGARQLAPLGYQFKLEVNFLAQKQAAVLEEIQALCQTDAKRQLAAHAQLGLPLRLWRYLVERAGIAPQQIWADLPKKSRLSLATQLTAASFPVSGKATNKEEFVTAGGVALTEINFKDFSAKQYPSLHLAGEVLDIDAITGGFNFQAAWTGGFLIGTSV